MIYRSKSVKETNKIARDLANKVSQGRQGKGAVVVALEGELGAGKTTFIKGFARALGIKERISSPTFVIMKSYNFKRTNRSKLVHIDAYRLKSHKDLLPLGIDDLASDPLNIILIEWSDRVKPVLPRQHIKIHIDHLDERTRKICIK